MYISSKTVLKKEPREGMWNAAEQEKYLSVIVEKQRPCATV